MAEPNFLFDLGADFCDRHETAFKMGGQCPKCAQAARCSCYEWCTDAACPVHGTASGGTEHG